MLQKMHTGAAPEPFGNEIHYDWLQQGRADAQLSDAALLSVPTFSLQSLKAGATPSRDIVVALQRYGVVLLTEHGVQSEMLPQARTFFGLPAASKNNLAKAVTPGAALLYQPVAGRTPIAKVKTRSPSPKREVSVDKASPSQPPQVARPPSPKVYMKTRIAYTPPRMEQLNPIMREDVKETFDYALEVEADGATHLGHNKFPALKGFEEDARKYMQENVAVARVMLRLICQGLGLAETAFDQHFEQPLAIQRLLRYPPQKPEEKDAIGAGAHVDFGAVTLLREDLPGLEVYFEGAWRIVQCPHGCMIVNTGFLLEKLTGGALRATQHRVVNRNAVPRFSTALFFDPNPKAVIVPMLPVKSVDAIRYKPCVSGQKGVQYRVGGYASKPKDQE